MHKNVCSIFLGITFFIPLVVPSWLHDRLGDYPSVVNAPYSWPETLSSGYVGFGDSSRVRPILVNGMFVCGFHCTSKCLFSVTIFNTNSSADFYMFPPPVVWSANRNNPVEEKTKVLELTSQGNLTLKHANGTVVWSTNEAGSRLNLSADGNLMLLNQTNHVVWQSFDHPTDSLLSGQGLAAGMELRANLSSDDPSEGLYAVAIIRDELRAYMVSDPSQIYYREEYTSLGPLYFYNEFLDSSSSFIQLGSDGHLKAYELKESGWEGTDLLGLDRCEYPLACGKYSECLQETCSCLDANENETIYFRPVNNGKPDLGCYAISPISCEPPLHHSFLHVRGSYSQSIYSFLLPEATTIQDCLEACLNNCSCKAAIYNQGNCSVLSEVLSIKKSGGGDVNSTAFIKVQNSPEKKGEELGVIVASTLGAIITAFLICGLFFLRAQQGLEEVEEYCLDDMFGMPTRFSYAELKNATKNFSIKLGEGGFGSVFHGILPSGSEVAVKHLVGMGSVNKSFIAEVQTIGSINHFNLVSLVGYCAENISRLLVYDYMANGSLDQWIFNKNQDLALGWQTRKKIILDIAKGLAYLHEECNKKIIHLDIKPQNILLDENFNAKVSDFGLSKLIGKDQSQVITTMRGTPGYMAPEWLSSVITEKVDVYSFGIVILEILCGRRNIDGSQEEEDRHLLALFRRKQEERQLMDLVDKCSDDMKSNASEVVEMMKVAAWCLQAEYAKRPSMTTVVKLLEGSVDVTDKPNEDFLNVLPTEAMESSASTVLPSMLSGPR